MHRLIVSGVLVVLACLLGACSIFSPSDLFSRNDLARVQVQAAHDLDSSFPTKLDIVFVYDSKAMSVMPGNSSEWWENKSGILGAFASEIDLVSLEIVPGSPVQDISLPKRHRRALKVLSYAMYPTVEGQAAVDLSSRRCVDIVLGAKKADYAACR